jgi:hypothetical protein
VEMLEFQLGIRRRGIEMANLWGSRLPQKEIKNFQALSKVWRMRKMGSFQRRADGLVLFLWWTNVKWRRLLHCPANCHDLSKLELSGAWEPPNSSYPQMVSEGKETCSSVFNGNQDHVE